MAKHKKNNRRNVVVVNTANQVATVAAEAPKPVVEEAKPVVEEPVVEEPKPEPVVEKAEEKVAEKVAEKPQEPAKKLDAQALGMAAGVGLRKAAEAAMVVGKAAGKTAKGAGDVLGAFFSGLKGGWNA